MKKINILYWIFTGLLVPVLGIGSVMDMMANPDSVKIVTSLGYPEYLVPFLGLCRLLALAVLLLPKLTQLKEWAYAGLTFDVITAIWSILASGQPLTHVIFPSIVMVILFASYGFHHKRLTFK